ncbi:transcription factor [Ganoderma sinense ZZ0214-1]|uniref:Transcription factor n=1 Tax=Ganoderma sinense ZZ0214-1 TaxID=1077348 RepID=A0A2G8S143_9APHY|nr:transcription factor [Ganoderma sinense ZZ0214-1]
MAPNPQCAALAAAKDKKGLSYAQIAEKIGQSEAHVVDVCTGKIQPTQDEFNALARALDITQSPPSDSAHKTK